MSVIAPTPPLAETMVLAAGHGLRMRPLTENRPKPLILLGDKPLLGHIFDHLYSDSISNIIVNACYHADQIKDYCRSYNTDIRVIVEDTALESGGGVKNALPWLSGQPLFVINGDIYWRQGKHSAIERLRSFWDDSRMDMLLLVCQLSKARGYDGAGDFHLDSDGRLHPLSDTSSNDERYVFTGIQILRPEILKDHSERCFSLSQFYHDRRTRLFGLCHDNLWHHVGDPDSLSTAQDLF